MPLCLLRPEVRAVVGFSELKPNSGLYTLVTSSGYVAQASPGFVFTMRPTPAELHHAVAVPPVTERSTQRSVVVTSDGYVYLLDSLLRILPGFPVSTGAPILAPPALADIDGDGVSDIVVCSGEKICVFNQAGFLLNNFPIAVSSDSTILASPVVGDVAGSGDLYIVVVTREGLVEAFDKNGKSPSGFPLLAGPNSGQSPAILTAAGGTIALLVPSSDGSVYAWKTGSYSASLPKLPWPQYMHDEQNTGLSDSLGTPKTSSSDFLPASEAYNWPNPVGVASNFITHIRYHLGQSAQVTIKIFDMAGDLVTQLSKQGVGGMDNEVVWDVSKIQSGVYFAHVDAQGSSNHGTAVIKIAVVK